MQVYLKKFLDARTQQKNAYMIGLGKDVVAWNGSYWDIQDDRLRKKYENFVLSNERMTKQMDISSVLMSK